MEFIIHQLESRWAASVARINAQNTVRRFFRSAYGDDKVSGSSALKSTSTSHSHTFLMSMQWLQKCLSNPVISSAHNQLLSIKSHSNSPLMIRKLLFELCRDNEAKSERMRESVKQGMIEV